MQLHLKEINPNPANPRAIRDEQFKSLKRSLAQFPQMLAKRGIAVIKDGGKWVAIGGNQRYRALCDLKKEVDDAGFADRYDATPQAVEVLTAYFAKGVPCVDCSDLDEYQQRRFVIADNLPFGEWDFEALANEWDVEDLHDWGLDVPGWGEGGGVAGDAIQDLSDKMTELFKIEIEFENEQQQEAAFNNLQTLGYKCKVLTL